MLNDNVFAVLTDTLTMRAVAEHYGFAVNRSGFMCCPFHSEKTSSLKVYDGSRGWWCFGCHIGGSIVDFIAHLFSLSSIDAAKKLSEDFNLNLFQNATFDRQKARAAHEARKKKLSETEAFEKLYDEKNREYRDIWLVLKNNKPTNHESAALYGRLAARLEYLDYWLNENKEAVRNGMGIH